MKTITLLLAASVAASTAFADQQKDGEYTFNGFVWGEEIGSIITHHREKSEHLQSKFNYMLLNNPDKSISGFKVEQIRYYFNPLPYGDMPRIVKCNEKTHKDFQDYCKLHRGTYKLESDSEQAFEKIKSDLEQKYGTPEKEVKTAPMYNRVTGEILTNREWTIYKFLRPIEPFFLKMGAPRESIVHLWKLNYDKDYTDPKTNLLRKAGLALISVDYRSNAFEHSKERLEVVKNKCRKYVTEQNWKNICSRLEKLKRVENI